MAATISNNNNLHFLNIPQPQLTSSTSTSTKGLYDALYQVEIPDKELQDLFQHSLQQDGIEQENEQDLEIIIKNIMQWLEVAHMTAFNIEQNLKREQPIETIEPLLIECNKMAPLIPLLIELSEMTTLNTTQHKITKIQSEWSGLQHFISSVGKLLEESNEKLNLLNLMSSILFQIDDLSLMIFQYQEKRHQEPESKSDNILIEIDNRVGPLFNDVEKVYNRMTSATDNCELDIVVEENSILLRKHVLIQEKWENLRIEIDELKIELKEDRWLIVFKQVADQVDGMMDGLDKTVQQCYIMIQQIKKENGLLILNSTSNSTKSSISTSSSSNGTGTNTVSTAITSTQQLDKLRSVEKNFDAKYKYYTPSITKMLMMLGNGIAARVSKNMATLTRHENMLSRWNSLKLTMDQLRKRDLPEISSSLGLSNTAGRPMSPATSICWSRLSDRSDNSSLLMKSPEPFHDNTSVHSGSNRSRSPYIIPSSSPSSFMIENSHTNSEMDYGARTTPTKRWQQQQQLENKSPSPVYGRSQQMSPYREKRSNLIPSSSSETRQQQRSNGGGYFSPTQINNTTMMKSSTIRRQEEEEEEEDYDDFDSITSNDFRKTTPMTTPTLRSKSSLSTTNRSLQSSRQQLNRSTTPSMIPTRAKTPTTTSLIPRPKTPSSRSPSRVGVSNTALGRIGSPLLSPRQQQQQASPSSGKYKPNPKDPLDKEIGLIINSSPIPIQCQKVPGSNGEGKYYFGNELTPSLGGGKKIYTCKLMTYDHHTRGLAAGGSPKRNKVLIRVGGGWQDLEIFLLEHMNLMGG